MNSDEADPRRITVAHLAEMGLPYKMIAREVGVNSNIAYKTARQRGVPRRLPIVSPISRMQIIALLLSTNMSYAHVARLVRVSKATVGRVAKDIRHRQLRRSGEFHPEPTKSAKRCPKHGLLKVWPCVACAAEAQSRARSSAAN